MAERSAINRRVVLAARPVGLPRPDDFRLEHAAVPTPDDGQVLLRTLYLSLDPYMRQLMDEVGPTYAPSVQLGAADGRRHRQSRRGVEAIRGFARATWFSATRAGRTTRCPTAGIFVPLGRHGAAVAGAGRARHARLHRLRRPARHRPAEARRDGGRGRGDRRRRRRGRADSPNSPARASVGIAGGADEVPLRGRRRSASTPASTVTRPISPTRLAAACPDGIDVYFENVGGAVFDAVLPLLNIGARVPVCGAIAHYNDATPAARREPPAAGADDADAETHPHAGLRHPRSLRATVSRRSERDMGRGSPTVA